MSLALCPQAVSRAPQYFRSSETLATCDGCFVRYDVTPLTRDNIHNKGARQQRPELSPIYTYLSKFDQAEKDSPDSFARVEKLGS